MSYVLVCFFPFTETIFYLKDKFTSYSTIDNIFMSNNRTNSTMNSSMYNYNSLNDTNRISQTTSNDNIIEKRVSNLSRAIIREHLQAAVIASCVALMIMIVIVVIHIGLQFLRNRTIDNANRCEQGIPLTRTHSTARTNLKLLH
jgi:hypothetical protein